MVERAAQEVLQADSWIEKLLSPCKGGGTAPVADTGPGSQNQLSPNGEGGRE